MKRMFLALSFVLVAAVPAAAARTDEELIARARAAQSVAPGVNLIAWDQSAPQGGWQRWWARPGQAPGFGVDPRRGAKGRPALVLGGAGREHVFGGWKYTIARVIPGTYYRFLVRAEVKGAPNIRRNVVCRVRWTGGDLGNEVTPDYILDYQKGQGFAVTFDEKFIAPERAEGAVVELLLQWAPAAEVAFQEVAFEVGLPAEQRVVRVATVWWGGGTEETVDKNIEALGALIDKAAAARPDVILLPETVSSIGTGLSPQDAAEELPGRTFLAFGAKARAHKAYIIYGVYEKQGDDIYNTAVILKRDGTLAGKYRKVQITPKEADEGVAAGDYFRTFDLDFGRVGVLLSHDAAFPESARALLLDGARVIFVPMIREARSELEARARDNGLWLVSSGIETPSLLIDPAGQVKSIAFGEIGEGACSQLINLVRKVRRPYVGDWRNQVIQQRRTDAYLKLVQE